MSRVSMHLTAGLALAGAASSLLLATPAASATNADAAVVRVETGQLRGVISADTIDYRGIPYAAPPIGERRFAPPAPAAKWQGVRDATKFAAMCPQGKVTNEDCLYLNVTVPKGATGKLPVMVWIHGGGFSEGSPNTYDASELASRGKVIVVGVEFRLNVFGLFALPGMAGSGTQILQDQQAALRWVQRNIASFGGDRRNVTLFGESGGAIGTCAHVASPTARGLFQKALMESGTCSTSFAADFIMRGFPAGGYFVPLASSEAKGLALAKAVGCERPDAKATLACLRQLPPEKIAAAGKAFFSASFGTPLLPLDPQKALESGRFNAVPVLTGFTQKEGLAVVAGMQWLGAPVTTADYPTIAREAFGDRAPEVLARYPLSNYAGRGDLTWAAIVTDRMFACPQLRDARTFAQRMPVFAYQFSDPNGAGLMPMPAGLPRGPSHSSELPLLFHLTDGPTDGTNGKRIERNQAQQQLSAQMIGYWTQFARATNPNGTGAASWPRFTTARPSVKWLATSDAVAPASGPEAEHQCTFWDGFITR